VLLLFFSSFIVFQNGDSKIAGTLINDLSSTLGKRSGCDNTKDALVLMEAYQIIFRELGGIVDKKEKTSKIRQSLIGSTCTTSIGDIVFNPRDLKPATITTISGNITIKRELPPYILALEMMTPKQKEEFQKALPENLQLEYLDWGKKNIKVKDEINKSLIANEVTPVDFDENLSELFQKALEKTPTIKLEDYQIDEKELEKLLNNQSLIQELNKQVIMQK
jgi:hypothetical protein